MEKADFEKLIPHAGRMCLLDRVLDWDEVSLTAETLTHRSPDHPLRSGEGLDAVHALEYGAQAMAIHAALSTGDGTRPGAEAGLLAASPRLRLEVERLDGFEVPLRVTVRRIFAQSSSLIYEFQVNAGNTRLADGEVIVVGA